MWKWRRRDRAGFEAVDVHMSDIIEGRVNLADFKGLVACGGFSYGDVLKPAYLGPSPCCSTPAPVTISKPSLRAAIPSRWVFAMAAR